MKSQNGYPVIASNRTTGGLPRLRKWIIPGTDRHVYLRDGSAGFLLVHLALWFSEAIERIGLGIWDDWGWAVRPVRGQVAGYSNHAAGCAVDLNATRHPRGVSLRTFSLSQVVAIRARLLLYRGCLRWGGDYRNSPTDGMHFEIVKPIGDVEKRALTLANTPRGRRILAANPGAWEVISSGTKMQGQPQPGTKAT